MTSITDAAKNAIIWLLIGACVILSGLSALFLARSKLASINQHAAEARVSGLTEDIERLKREAAAELRTANASVLAQQTRLDAGHQKLERQSVLDKKVVGDASDQLRGFRSAARLRSEQQAAGRGPGGAAQQGAAAAGAEPGAGDQAGRAGLLREAATAEGDDDARTADRINIAYAACRSDAYGTREIVALADGTWFVSAIDPPEAIAP